MGKRDSIRIFLFDLDGTLVWSGGAGSRALDLAFEEIFGIREGMREIVCDGKTDRAIVREVLAPRGMDSAENIDRLLENYLVHLAGTVARADGYQVLPGVVETLEHLGFLPGMVCGLATGNVREGAKTKLARADLWRHFPVGGFGSDAEERSGLVRIGLDRARLHLGDPHARAVVIGDTPLDIQAAHAVDLPAVGVATGHFGPEELERGGADLMLSDLTRPREWLAKLEGS